MSESPYRSHRAALLEKLRGEGAAAVFATGSLKVRNHDCEYRFRPESDFWYLTGFEEPDSVLVLRPGAEDGNESILFVRKRVKEEETWTGRRLGVDAAPGELGVDKAFPVDELWDVLPNLLEGFGRVVYRMGLDADRDERMIAAVAGLERKARRGTQAPTEWLAPGPFTHEMRLRKSPAEVERMRQAAAIAVEAHTEAMREARPGLNERALDARIEYLFKLRGSNGPAYTNIVAGGANACVLHYIENNCELERGDLVLIDAGAEWEYYASDITRTFPVSGRFSDEQRALYTVVLEAQKAAIEAIGPGATFASIHEEAVRYVTAGLLELGILEGSMEEALEKKAYSRFFMHQTGHWLGLDVHDCGAYHVDGESRPLEPGMVTTVEPGVYISPDDETVDERWRGIGIRIEDDVLVTKDGHEVLTAAVPKEIEEIEALCQGAELQPAS